MTDNPKHNRRFYDFIESDMVYFINQHIEAEKLSNAEVTRLANDAIAQLKSQKHHVQGEQCQ